MRKKKERQSEQVKIQRMLKWFEAQLPEHEVGKWYFQIEPHKLPLLDESETLRMGSHSGLGVIVGYGSCTRCGQRFELERWGNYTVFAEDEQERLKSEYPTLTTEAKIQKAKEVLQRDAERSGKCWGDMPRIETRPDLYPTLDSAASAD